jgi:hypothetical protein
MMVGVDGFVSIELSEGGVIVGCYSKKYLGIAINRSR